MRRRWRLFLLGAVVLIGAGLAQTQPGHVVFSDVGLYQTAKPYTALSFTDPDTLPTALKKPSSSFKISFDINNVSGDSKSYQWSVALVHAGKSQVKASGAVLAPAQGQTAVSRTVTATCASGRLQVVVRLAGIPESISFWISCPPAAAKK
jgi:hypothetical protein